MAPPEGKTLGLFTCSPPLMRQTVPGKFPLSGEDSSQCSCHCAFNSPMPKVGTTAGPLNDVRRVSSQSFSGSVQMAPNRTLEKVHASHPRAVSVWVQAPI